VTGVEPGHGERVVVDTDVLSFVLKGDSRSAEFEPVLDGRTWVVSFQVVAELYRWADERNHGSKRIAELEALFRKLVIVPSSNALAREWARVSAECNRLGRPISCGDAWVAATARLFELPLVTHNRKDFEGVPGLVLLP
jgi:predicted nucleic acid-binding protein